MTEKNFTGLIFDNIFPKNIGKESKQIYFHDSNDIILNSQKEETEFTDVATTTASRIEKDENESEDKYEDDFEFDNN